MAAAINFFNEGTNKIILSTPTQKHVFIKNVSLVIKRRRDIIRRMRETKDTLVDVTIL